MSISEANDPSLVLGVSLPVVDEDQVSLLLPRPGEDDSMLQELLGIFEAESEPRLKQIKISCESQDAESLGKLVHFIAGSSANLGALRLSTLCRQVETALGRNEFFGYDALPGLLDNEYKKGLNALKAVALHN